MSKTLATRMAFGDELLKIAETNPDFVVCNADTKTCGLEKFGKRFPEREFSFGIAEQDLVGGAAGLAACGTRCSLRRLRPLPPCAPASRCGPLSATPS